MLKRALISVFDKEGVLELSKFLEENGVEIISTGGTYKYLKENGINVVEVSDVTGFEEILDGRVKTLHPIIHAGILAVRDNKEHMQTLAKKNIKPIDMVVVNLYPFFDKVQEDISFAQKVEFIDIGGPTMIRAAGKNFKDVIVLTDKNDYSTVIDQIKNDGDVAFELRKKLAGKVFNLMSSYDAAIANFLLDETYPEYLSLSYKKSMDLRYGENPHQSAAYYTAAASKGSMKDFEQLNGKALSYNNIKDMDVAWKVANEFEEIACCAVKHNTPCGVAVGDSVLDAYMKAHACDPTSIFGGVIALNRTVDEKAALELKKIFLEIVIAPNFTSGAVEILKGKKNLRVIKCTVPPQSKIEIAKVDGGILVQSSDNKLYKELKVVTKVAPDKKYMEDLIFAMKVCKYVKSNAIVIVKDKMAIGIGGGQVNRIWAATEALDRAKDGVVMASDAFFPFADVATVAAEHGIKAIIQPGGSMHDQDSIDECDKNAVAMIFTGTRHFKH